ncbi:MAG: sigma-70 family RNA polymerase sigma factor [Pirellulales bacterium]|nr:sigma-70 family RNA polymerase sigma factor [Pirellulales bacterium]
MRFNKDAKDPRATGSSRTRATLLRRIRDGSDPVAWEEFFARYWRLVFFFARRRGCSEHTAEEVVQDVMATVFHNRDVFRYDPAQGRFRDWLATVVRNQVAMYRRAPAQRIRAHGSDGFNKEQIPQNDTDTTPDELWETAFEETLLAALLDVVRRQVEPRTYQAFELTALGELSGAEVSAVTGLSRNAVYQARRAVIKRLKDLGSTYRDDGRLDSSVKRALELQPSPQVQRSIASRVTATMESKGYCWGDGQSNNVECRNQNDERIRNAQ